MPLQTADISDVPFSLSGDKRGFLVFLLASPSAAGNDKYRLVVRCPTQLTRDGDTTPEEESMRRQIRTFPIVAAVLCLLAGTADQARADLTFTATGTFLDMEMLSGTLTIDTELGKVTTANLMVGTAAFNMIQSQATNKPVSGDFELFVGVSSSLGSEPSIDMVIPAPNLVGYAGGPLGSVT